MAQSEQAEVKMNEVMVRDDNGNTLMLRPAGRPGCYCSSPRIGDILANDDSNQLATPDKLVSGARIKLVTGSSNRMYTVV